jgi:hypothetical protein
MRGRLASAGLLFAGARADGERALLFLGFFCACVLVVERLWFCGDVMVMVVVMLEASACVSERRREGALRKKRERERERAPTPASRRCSCRPPSPPSGASLFSSRPPQSA